MGRKKSWCYRVPSVDDAKRAPRLPTVPVVVELFADGYVQIFAPGHVRAVVVNHLADGDGPNLATLADEFHFYELSPAHRSIYDPRCMVATGNLKRRTIAGEADRQWALAFLRGIRAAGDLLRRKKQ